MAYSDFSLADLKARFLVAVSEDANLFEQISPVDLSAVLAGLLADNVPLALAIDTEKARSEFIIAPILAECRKVLQGKISLFSGVEFPVDPDQGLNGLCDFIISRSPEQFYVSVPVVVLVEAKNNRIKEEIPQCIAAMIAARLFNERQGNEPTTIYGVVTTGSLWRFLQLDAGQVAIDREEYYLRDVKKILGILLHITAGG
jgi:hypothetical protein